MNTTRVSRIIVCCMMTGILFAGVLPAKTTAGECEQLVAELSQLKGLIKRKKFLDEAVKKCSDDYLITYYYAYNFERRRKYDRALQLYQSAIELNPDNARSYFGLGDSHLALRQNEEAIAAFEKGLRLDPGNIWARKSMEKAREGLVVVPDLPVVAAKKKNAVVQSVPVVSTAEKSENVTAESVAVQLLPTATTVFVEEVVPAPVFTPAAPEEVITLSQLDNGLEEEKDLTAEDFIERMQMDSGAAQDVQAPVLQMQIQFNASSGDLTAQAMEQLDAVVCKALRSEDLRRSKFEVAGHTDDSGSFEINMHISRLRAHSVKQYLVESCGVAPERIDVVYYGETRPLLPNTSRKNRRLNRRVEFRRISGQDKMMRFHQCPTEMSLFAGADQGIYAGGLADNYFPVP